MSTPATANKLGKPPLNSKPIELLNNDAAKLFSYLHPALVLALLAMQFRSLVNDPVSTLMGTALPLGLVQVIYVVLCLPSTGKVLSSSAPGKRKKRDETDWGARIVPAFLALFLAIALGTPLLAIIAVLFGAPLTTHQPHTLLLALHISLLTLVELIYVHGVDGKKWLEIASLSCPVDEIYGMALGALLGAWVGAVPIPLDWDREWQKWPVTIVTGAYLGAVVGKVVGGYVLKGKKIKMT